MMLELTLCIRLGKEPSTGWNIPDGRRHLARGDQESDRRPSVLDDREEPKAVHRARHLDIREDHSYAIGHFEKPDCVVSIHGFDHLKADVPHHVCRAHADQEIVLYDQNDGFFAH